MYRIAFLLILMALVPGAAWASGYPERTIDVTSLDLSLTIPLENSGYDVFENKLHGTAQFTLVNTGNERLDVIPVLLYRLMKANAVTDAAGNAIPFSQHLTALENNELMQVNYLQIRPRHGLASGEKITFTITYEGTLAGYTETGMLYVQEKLDPDFTIIRYETYAYPQVLFPDAGQRREAWKDLYNQTLHVTVPEGHVAVNATPLKGRETVDGMTTFTFESDEARGIIILPIAPYGTVTSGANSIYYLPEDQAGAKALASAMEQAMALYTEWFGPLQQEGGLDVVEIPEWYGSQTDFPMIIQTADAFKTQSELGQLYHELSHLWNVPDPDPDPARWNEGLAMFLQGLMTEKLTGGDSLSAWQQRLFERFKRAVEGQDALVPMRDYGTAGVTGLSYSGGGVFFGLLYEILGERKFLRFTGDFYQARYQSGATTQDFIDALHGLGDPRADALVRDWFETARYGEAVSKAKNFADLARRYRK